MALECGASWQEELKPYWENRIPFVLEGMRHRPQDGWSVLAHFSCSPRTRVTSPAVLAPSCPVLRTQVKEAALMPPLSLLGRVGDRLLQIWHSPELSAAAVDCSFNVIALLLCTIPQPIFLKFLNVPQ